jgi:hypothetical protein
MLNSLVQGDMKMDATSVIAVLGIPGVAIICWAVTQIAAEWRKARQTECLAALKQEMVQRGMSADEIVRVLQAGGHAQEESSPSAKAHAPVKDTAEFKS